MGGTNGFKYERLIHPNYLELGCKKYRPTPSGWRSRHMIFRSGMAAITSLLQNVRPYLFADNQEPVTLDYFGGYFETKVLFDLFSSPLFSFRRHASQDGMLHEIEHGNSQLLFLEPVSYDWEMEALDLNKLYTALTLRKRLPRMIIVDTTIIGNTFPLDQFLSALPGEPPPIVMQINSCLKLDQEGLELANAGIASLFWRRNDTKHGEAALTLAKKMSRNRMITGTGLSLDEMAILDVPWFLNPERSQAHSQSVFENNRQLASILDPVIASADGIFSHVSHPSLRVTERVPWAVAPFVIFHFREELDNKKAHTRLTTLLSKVSRKNHLGFGEGMSFGFRGHRFEIIKPNSILHPNGQAKWVLKVAMGCRQGPTRDAIINLLAEIAQCSEIPDTVSRHRKGFRSGH